MRFKALPLAFILVAILVVVPVACSTVFSVTYDKFNNTSRTEYAIGETYHNWTVAITNHLTFNESSSNYGQIFLSNSSATGYWAIMLNIAKEGDKFSLDIYLPSKVDPGPSDWIHLTMIHNLTMGEPVYITLDKDGYLSVGNKEDLKAYVKDYAFGDLDLKYIGVCGSGTDVATAGYVSFEVSKAKAYVDVVDLTDTLIYLMVTVIPLAIIVYIFEKVFKKLNL